LIHILFFYLLVSKVTYKSKLFLFLNQYSKKIKHWYRNYSLLYAEYDRNLLHMENKEKSILLKKKIN